MTKLYERPNLLSVFILIGVMLVGVAYVIFTLDRRPETESFTVEDDYTFPFNFDRVDNVARLPNELEEVSGLAYWSAPDFLLAVQDELGKVYVVNPRSGEIVEEIRFDEDRDYEGVTRKGDTIYVLEADGDMHYFTYDQAGTDFEAKKLGTDFSYRNDVEGICYDSLTNSMLLVPKAQQLNPGDGPDSRRGIYSYSLSRRELIPQPTYFVDENLVGEAVFGDNRKYVIKPSGIAVDPLTSDIYVLSSVGNVLVVIDRDNRLLHVELLEGNAFAQPEGITFTPNGDLYISSEGRGGDGVIVTLKRLAKVDTQ